MPLISNQLLFSHMSSYDILYTETFTAHINKGIQTVYLILSSQELNISVQALTKLHRYVRTSRIKRSNQVHTYAAVSICYVLLHAGSHRKLLCLRHISAAQHATDQVHIHRRSQPSTTSGGLCWQIPICQPSRGLSCSTEV